MEHIVSLRIIPNLVVLRPADARETAEAWRIALERTDGPTALLLSRQKLPTLPAPADRRSGPRRLRTRRGIDRRARGSSWSPPAPRSAWRWQARELLEADGVPTRVVSAPSLELLARQDEAYRKSRPGTGLAHCRVAIELGRGQGWHRWIGDGEMIVLSRFGESAPAEDRWPASSGSRPRRSPEYASLAALAARRST